MMVSEYSPSTSKMKFSMVQAVIGLGLAFLVAESPVVSFNFFDSFGGNPMSLGSLIAALLACLLLVIYLKIPDAAISNRRVFLLAMSLLTGVMVFVALGQYQLNQMAVTATEAVYKFGCVVLLIAWFEKASLLDQEDIVELIGISMLVCAAASLLLVAFKLEVARYIDAISPLASAVLLITAFGNSEHAFDGGHQGASNMRAPFILFIATVACAQFAFSSIQFNTSIMHDDTTVSLAGMYSSALGIACAALLVLLARKRAWNFNSVFFYLAMLVISLISAFALFARLGTQYFAFYMLPSSFGQKLMLVMVFISAYLNNRWRKQCTWCLLFALYAATTGAYCMLSNSMPAEALDLGVACVVTACIVLVAAMHFATSSKASLKKDASKTGELPAKRAEEFNAIMPDNEARDSILALSDDYALTQRETEILMLLAQRYNAEAVSEKLVITVATAKTHMRSIYAKLDVHSQKELLDLIAGDSKT